MPASLPSSPVAVQRRVALALVPAIARVAARSVIAAGATGGVAATLSFEIGPVLPASSIARIAKWKVVSPARPVAVNDSAEPAACGAGPAIGVAALKFAAVIGDDERRRS